MSRLLTASDEDDDGDHGCRCWCGRRPGGHPRGLAHKKQGIGASVLPVCPRSRKGRGGQQSSYHEGGCYRSGCCLGKESLAASLPVREDERREPQLLLR